MQELITTLTILALPVLFAITPVSYTHLDVYKRQGTEIPTGFPITLPTWMPFCGLWCPRVG